MQKHYSKAINNLPNQMYRKKLTSLSPPNKSNSVPIVGPRESLPTLLIFRESVNSKGVTKKQPTTYRNQEVTHLDQLNLKVIRNHMVEEQLKPFQFMDLNNIPINQQLVDKAIFKYTIKTRKQLKEAVAIKPKPIKAISQSVENLFYFGKSKGLPLKNLERRYKERNTSQDMEQNTQQQSESYHVIDSYRPQRSSSHHMLKLKSGFYQQQKSFREVNHVKQQHEQQMNLMTIQIFKRYDEAYEKIFQQGLY